MHLRPAEEADRKRLAAFRCAPDNAPNYQVEVEAFAHDLLDWLVAEVGRVVRVLEDRGEIVGFVAYEPDGEDDFYVNAVGVDKERHGERLGRMILVNTLADLADGHPNGMATWLVHPANLASISMCDAIGADASYPPEDRPYVRFAIEL